MIKVNIKKNKNITFFKKIQKGLSLIELIVSIGIIMMMTTMFMANYQSSNKRTDLVMTAQRVVADIHAAQNNALGLVKYNGEVPAGGWGISFDPVNNKYTMFADLNLPGALGYLQYDPIIEGDINYGARVTEISPGLIISALEVGGESATIANVSFLPPDPQTNIYNNSGATSTELKITIQEKNNPTNIKTVRVNFLGLAEVID